VIGAGPDPAASAWIKVFSYSGTAVTEHFSLRAFPSSWTHGVNVAAGWFHDKPTDDAFINQRHPNELAEGDHLETANWDGGPPNDDNWERDILIRFDLSHIPEGTSIKSATLYIYYYHWDDTDPVDRNLTCYRITGAWNEETVTWNKKPTYAPVVTADSKVPSAWGWMSWNVTEDVGDFVNGRTVNWGWQIMDEEPWGTWDIPTTFFRCKETKFPSQVPYLEVETTDGNRFRVH